MQVNMLSDVFDAGGSLLPAGSSQDVIDSVGLDLIGTRRAVLKTQQQSAPNTLTAEETQQLRAITGANSEVSLPFHRRMELRTGKRAMTSMVATSLARRVRGDGSMVFYEDVPLIWSGYDWVAPRGILNFFKFSGGIPFLGAGIPTKAKIISIQNGIGCTLDRPAYYTTNQLSLGNGINFHFGANLVADSYTVSNTSGQTTITGMTAAQTGQLRVGMLVSGVGVPGTTTTIASIQPGTGFTMSAASTANVSAVTIGGIPLTAGTNAGDPAIFNQGTSTIGANTSLLEVGMSVTGMTNNYVVAPDLLSIPVPAGLVTPGSRLRIEYGLNDNFTYGNTGFRGGVANINIVCRAANPLAYSSGNIMVTHAVNINQLPTAKTATRHWCDIAFLDNCALICVDGETASAGARVNINLSGYSSGIGIADFSCDQEIVIKGHVSATYENSRCHVQLGEVTATLYYC